MVIKLSAKVHPHRWKSKPRMPLTDLQQISKTQFCLNMFNLLLYRYIECFVKLSQSPLKKILDPPLENTLFKQNLVGKLFNLKRSAEFLIFSGVWLDLIFVNKKLSYLMFLLRIQLLKKW